MKRPYRCAARFAALCLNIGVLLTSLACGRIDLDSRPESEPDEERQQNYPPPRITLGPPTTRVELGPNRGGPGGGPLGSDGTAPLAEPDEADASVADAAPAPVANDEPLDAGIDAEAP
jgi:hypothetical protein